MIDKGTILRHYKREDVQKEIIEHAKDKEVAIKYSDKGFGKRPDILSNPNDILELAKQGASSFHCSEELWKNPLQLTPMLKKKELEDLRKGWDLVLDIDCPYFEYSKIAADLLVRALKHHGIKSISCKFSGNKGFHIGVPFEAFPSKVKLDREIDAKVYFPDGVRCIAGYLKDMTKDIFAKKIYEIENGNITKIASNSKKNPKDILKLINGKSVLDPEAILEIDTVLISSRHLYRMPYSLHEKSGLVSIPIDIDKIMEFNREDAHPDKAEVNKYKFIERENVMPGEARELFDKAIYSLLMTENKKEFKSKETNYYEELTEALPKELFPPCVNNILKGMEDGKKRAMFLLMNFLSSVGWNYDEIDRLMKEWNEKNPEPLKEQLILGQIRYHKQHKKKILPPNCANQMYYKDMRVCTPDNLCSKIKNPVNYSRRKAYYLNKKGGNKKKKTDQKKTDDK